MLIHLLLLSCFYFTLSFYYARDDDIISSKPYALIQRLHNIDTIAARWNALAGDGLYERWSHPWKCGKIYPLPFMGMDPIEKK